MSFQGELNNSGKGEGGQFFLLRLADALRPIVDPFEIQQTAARLLGQHLAASRVGYAEIEGELPNAVAVVACDWTDGAESIAGEHSILQFGQGFIDDVRDGRTIRVNDMFDHPSADEGVAQAFGALGIRAAITATLVKSGRPEAVLFVHDASPRNWSDAQVALVEDVGERTWAAVGRARAEAALRESELRYRTLFENVEVGFCVVEVELSDPVDYRVIEANPAFYEQTGFPLAIFGQWLREAAPALEEVWYEAYGAVARSGRPSRFEQSSAMLGRSFEVHAFPAGGNADGRVAVFFSDITERKRAELALREREARQAVLLRLADALRPLDDPAEICSEACRVLGEWLKVDRAYYVEIDEAAGWARVDRDYVRGDAPSIAGLHPVARFRWSVDVLRTGECHVVEDTRTSEIVPEADRAASIALQIVACMGTPLIKGGILVGALCITDREPRRWTEAEIATVKTVGERIWAAVERARAEAALRESEERFRHIVESARDYAIFTTGPDRRINDWHDGAEAVFGYPAHEVIGRDASLLFTPEDRAAGEVERELNPAMREGSAANVRWHLHRNGGRIFIEGRTIALRNGNGAVRGFLKIGQDVTARINRDDEMRRNEERLRLALEAGRLATWDWTITTGEVSWSDEHFRIQGYEVGEVTPSFEAWAARVHPDDIEETKAALESAAKLREHYRHAFRQLHPDGTVRWCSAQGTYFYDELGAPIRMIGVMEDVTERRLVQQKLHQSEERFRQFAENSADALWIVDATREPVELEYISPAFERIWGIGRDELLPDIGRFADFLHPDDRERVAQAMPRLLSGETHSEQYRIIRPDNGMVRWIFDTGFPIKDLDGIVIRAAGISQDVTDRKLAEDAVQESRRQLRALIEGVPQLVWRASDAGRWIWASPQWTEYTGQSEDDSTGHGWLEMVHLDDRAVAADAWKRASGTDGFQMTGRLRRKDGAYRWFQTRAAPVFDEADKVVEWLGTCTDIDDLHRLQDQQNVLVAELQHRTRNLLAVVRSIGSQTIATSVSLDDFGSRFNDRLGALSRVQGLLSRADKEPITIGALVRAELDALGTDILPGRIRVEGPDVTLRNSMVQTLALAIHELATNARKYGALSCRSGYLDVSWSIDQTRGPRLDIVWDEKLDDGTHEEQISAGGGYGRKLIERALPYSLNAETNYVVDRTGVHCRISLPLGD